jgi:hypothetical protein
MARVRRDDARRRRRRSHRTSTVPDRTPSSRGCWRRAASFRRPRRSRPCPSAQQIDEESGRARLPIRRCRGGPFRRCIRLSKDADYLWGSLWITNCTSPSARLLARISDEDVSRRKRCSGMSVKRSAYRRGTGMSFSARTRPAASTRTATRKLRAARHNSLDPCRRASGPLCPSSAREPIQE